MSDQLDKQELKLRLAQLAVLEKVIKDEYTAAKRQYTELIDPGESAKVKTVDGLALGTISKSQPRTTIQVDDEDVFFDWVSENMPKGLEDFIPEDFLPTAVEVIKEYAPNLLAQRVNARTRRALLGLVEQGEMIPGVVVITAPDGTIAVRTVKATVEEIRERFRAGFNPELVGFTRGEIEE